MLDGKDNTNICIATSPEALGTCEARRPKASTIEAATSQRKQAKAMNQIIGLLGFNWFLPGVLLAATLKTLFYAA
jgi:hypothetical protein